MYCMYQKFANLFSVGAAMARGNNESQAMWFRRKSHNNCCCQGDKIYNKIYKMCEAEEGIEAENEES